MFKQLILSTVIVVLVSLSTVAQTTKRLKLPKSQSTPSATGPGNIQLLSGYSHFSMRGIDTSVGEIRKADGMTIHYDIGRLAGNYAAKCQAKGACLWFKRQSLNGSEVWFGLTKEGEIIASFRNEFANFFAQTKSPEEIVDFLIMIMTFKAPESR